ncbi:Ppx/GppA family phosphatase [Ignavibacteria bacterium CHB1]|nr:MAG: Ppx/GppA family phosphatase [Chlorobiota bacterium]MBV6399318.1 Exopolyphosphatase [Ignavibacteria bacterium]MCC6886762.1 Ppx/GppA family phosphatase [Ignavibacteriales bacterium]MCE7953699.1 Ppx/GppA family phosphatase [Chlorobi bacterium CHB7]MDL1887635.1 Ppx/GppA family phosphatase [Ignavibacteria bacterium CHB1]RIK48141.1 MAG: exopolyphosphatase [Ignavibacteriota bacterium]
MILEEFDISKNHSLAAIDIGTNSIHIVVAKVTDINRFKVLTSDKEVVRLGSGSRDMKYLNKEAMNRAIKALKRFKLICNDYNAVVRAVATSATREAINRDEFINQVFEKTGIVIEVVSGYEEARLIYLGVIQALPVFKKKILVIDIGGGSTEFVLGNLGNVNFGQSIKIGAIRLTNKYFPEGITSKKRTDDARTFVKSSINPIVRALDNQGFDLVVGTSGTITNIGQMIIENGYGNGADSNNINNFVCTRDAVEKLSRKILKIETPDGRKKIPGIDPKRLDIIPAGVIIVDQILKELNIDSITISNYALREGIILDTIQKSRGSESLGHLSDVRYKSVMTLARQSNFEEEHSQHVSKLALKIFDSISKRFNLTMGDREYLQAASVLHDIGYFISHSSHHKHSYYIIRNSEMLGFNFNEIEIIANIARYHRKSHPKIKHDAYSRLDDKSKNIVRKLAGILRVADGLDRGHNCKVKELEIFLNKSTIRIKAIPKKDENVNLEIWGANRRKKLFEEEFGVKLEIGT